MTDLTLMFRCPPMHSYLTVRQCGVNHGEERVQCRGCSLRQQVVDGDVPTVTTDEFLAGTRPGAPDAPPVEAEAPPKNTRGLAPLQHVRNYLTARGVASTEEIAARLHIPVKDAELRLNTWAQQGDVELRMVKGEIRWSLNTKVRQPPLPPARPAPEPDPEPHPVITTPTPKPGKPSLREGILAWLQEHPGGWTAAEVAEGMDGSANSVHATLSVMRSHGHVCGDESRPRRYSMLIPTAAQDPPGDVLQDPSPAPTEFPPARQPSTDGRGDLVVRRSNQAQVQAPPMLADLLEVRASLDHRLTEAKLRLRVLEALPEPDETWPESLQILWMRVYAAVQSAQAGG